MIQMRLANFTAAPEFRALELCNLTSEETSTALYSFNTPRFNTNRSFLRLEPDGDLKMYSSSQFNKWDIAYQRFGCWRGVPRCDLVRKFRGSMVVSRRCQCVACAQADGIWELRPVPHADSKDTHHPTILLISINWWDLSISPM